MLDLYGRLEFKLILLPLCKHHSYLQLQILLQANEDCHNAFLRVLRYKICYSYISPCVQVKSYVPKLMGNEMKMTNSVSFSK